MALHLEGSSEQEYDPLNEHSMQLFVEQAQAIQKKFRLFRETLEENNDLKKLANLKATQLNERSTRLEGKERELEKKDIQFREKLEENKKLKSLMETKDTQLMEKDREIERLRETIDQQDIQLRKTTLECLESSRERNLKQRKIEELMETKASIEERFVELMKEKSDLAFELNDAKYKINDLTLQVSDCIIEASRLTEDKKRLSEKRNRLTDENNRLTEDRDRIASQRNKLAKKLKKISNGSEAVESEDEEKQILITQVNAYSRECDKLKGQLQTQCSEYNRSLAIEKKNCLRLESELRDQLLAHEQHNEKITRLTKDIEELTRQLDGCNKELSTEKDKVLEWSRKYDKEKEKREHLHKKHRAEKERHHEANVKHCDIIDQLLKELQRADKIIPRLEPSLNLIPESTTDENCCSIDQLLRDLDESRKNLLARNKHRYSDSTTSAYKASSSAAVATDGTTRERSCDPTAQEVVSSDDERPYDPSLVCPKCGRKFRVGQEQKQRRHINEFCTMK
ncbi:PREDICTED: ELKS/Rab6-interacting/CAST family member 1-like [Amphimedon queenslandica]|uniref:Uncharacterized protein n=1 Tax=Amphimedon queenslandica TaxID=400682 RepID=A0AAN0JTW2_AMPQE|nr:PREDICTED: ELKS/Rab6-interacting/CAST family member 1-like [Amphimedon queenslandica]|eukprot:XP_019860482.1 PREDICTED: ELKS/Rab6-interacting/CAST family member 1-like [Amphimedon queenslandica]